MPEPEAPGGVSGAVSRSVSRRGFIARLGAVLTGAAGAGTLLGALRAPEADAHHFCGHVADTGSCPHPTGLPRVDARGYPLRARDGRPVDDLGRVVDEHGRPVDARGRPLRDADGRPLEPAPRSRVCQDAVPARYGFAVHRGGSWYRCCGGRVRRLMDCCSHHGRRINGDAAVRGYCDADSTVFCVLYHQSEVPC